MALPKVMIGSLATYGGSVAAAPLGTRLPENATDSLDEGFKTRGLIGPEGFTWFPNRDKAEIEVEGGNVARELTTKYSEKTTFTLMESANAEVLKAVFGAENVKNSGKKIAINHNGKDVPELAWVLSLKDGEARRRLVIPKGQLSLSSEVVFVHNDAIKYTVDIAGLVDDKGNASYEYIDEAGSDISESLG